MVPKKVITALISSITVANAFQQPNLYSKPFAVKHHTTSAVPFLTNSEVAITKSYSFKLHTSLIPNNEHHEESEGNKSRSKILMERVLDTMAPAGFDAPPVLALTGKRTAMLLAGLMVWRWYRAKFLLKQKFTEKQPAWGHVITNKDQEKNLHAWTCKECGTTMFIAKGREIRFFNRFVECYNCGAKGKDSFYDRREEIASDDDTDFEYENPLDYVTRGERKKLEKEVTVREGRGETVDTVALMEEQGLAEKGPTEIVDDVEETNQAEVTKPVKKVTEPVKKVTEPVKKVTEPVKKVTEPVKKVEEDDDDLLGMDL